jgi:ABC-type polar amino acid transport system ATPase subunit
VSALLAAEGVRLSRGAREILCGLSFSVEPGRLGVLMGLSGSGKTTALRAVTALDAFQAGTIEVGGFRLAPGPVPPESRLKELRRKVGLVFQAHALFEHLTALENVLLAPLHVLRVPRREAEARARPLLEAMGVAHRADAYPRELSGGEAQRVAIARALALEPHVVLFDEPTSALDPELVGSVLQVMRELRESGMTMVVVSHELSFARAAADRVVFMDHGRIVEEGPPDKIFAAPDNARVREFVATISGHH